MRSWQLESAVTTFDNAVLDRSGLFGPEGAVTRAYAAGGFTSNGLMTRVATSISSVSGTARNGTATLTATLTSPATGKGISSQLVSFTLDGAYAGVAVTDSNGVATFAGVLTSDSAGTDSGGVVASYAGALVSTRAPARAT